MAKAAVTEYKVEKTFEKEGTFSLLKVFPKTGRTHQIRVHLASIGHPIVGDRLYGGKGVSPIWATRMMLHAASLEFTAPDGKRVKFEAETPDFPKI
jgi:23S rRNA-/tRNA-specific pseudouridylate synthase